MNIKAETINGIKWVGAGQAIKYPVQIVVSVVLARLIAPEAFGLVSMVTVISGFAGLFINFGFSSALVQKKEVNDRLLSSVFWINVAIGLSLCLMFLVLSYPIALFYAEPALINLTLALSFTFVIPAFNSVQLALLNRQMRFDLLTKREIASFVTGSIVAILGACLGWGVWALVAQIYATSLMGVILLWSSVQWRPERSFSVQEINSIWSYGKNLTGFTIANYLVRNLDNFLIGKFISPAALGIYSRGYAFVTLPIRQVSSVLAKVMFPSLSKIQDDHERFRRVYVKLCQATALITFPAMVGLFLVAEPFVLVFLGAAWIEVIPILKIFSLLGAAQSIMNTVGWIYNATGRTDLLFKWGLFAGAVIISSFIIGIWMGGIYNVAICYAIGSGMILLIPNFTIPFKIIDLKLTTFLKALLPLLLCTVFMGLGVLIILEALDESEAYLQILASSFTGVIVYVLILESFKVSIYKEVKQMMKGRILKRKKTTN